MKWIILVAALAVLVNLTEASNNAGEDSSERKSGIDVAAVLRLLGSRPHHGGSASLISQPFVLCFASLLATGVFLIMIKKNQGI